MLKVLTMFIKICTSSLGRIFILLEAVGAGRICFITGASFIISDFCLVINGWWGDSSVGRWDVDGIRGEVLRKSRQVQRQSMLHGPNVESQHARGSESLQTNSF